MKKVLFIKNAAILTTTSLILRFMGIFFKVWLAAAVGSEGIGLYQLIFSVYMLAATFTAGGISTAVTRLVSDELVLGSKRGVLSILRKSVVLTSVLAILSTAAVYFFASPIAKYAIGDIRAIPALKTLSFSLPFMGVSSCVKGYFIARRKTLPGSISQIFEQLVRIGVVVALVCSTAHKGIEYACTAVLVGDTVAEGASMLLTVIFYNFDKKYLKNLRGRNYPNYGVSKEIMRIAAPITGGRYLSTALRTVENMLVPASLVSFGMENSAALSNFGMIKGMALPILFFPSSLLGAVSVLLIPEICEAKVKNQIGVVKSLIKRVLKITTLSGSLFGAFFLVCGGDVGILIYKNNGVGSLITALAPLTPLMYLDSVCDGILKGLDEQSFTFRNSLIDCGVRIGLVWYIVPRFAMPGFLGIMYVSNIFTCAMNVSRLIKVTGVKIRFLRGGILPFVLALAACFGVSSALEFFSMGTLWFGISTLIIATLVYIILLQLTGVTENGEIKSLFSFK